jgi:hypothetical protein
MSLLIQRRNMEPTETTPKKRVDGKRMASRNVRITPVFRDEIDINKLELALLRVAEQLAKYKEKVQGTASK